jgi:hypothetical protein
VFLRFVEPKLFRVCFDVSRWETCTHIDCSTNGSRTRREKSPLVLQVKALSVSCGEAWLSCWSGASDASVYPHVAR